MPQQMQRMARSCQPSPAMLSCRLSRMPSRSKGTSTLAVAAILTSAASAVWASVASASAAPAAPAAASPFSVQRLHREAAVHLGEERVHAFVAGRAAADGRAEAGGARVAAGDRQQRGGLAPRVVERVEVEAAVAAEHLVHLDEAAGVAGAQAEDHLGRRLVRRRRPSPSRAGWPLRPRRLPGSAPSRSRTSGRSRSAGTRTPWATAWPAARRARHPCRTARARTAPPRPS